MMAGQVLKGVPTQSNTHAHTHARTHTHTPHTHDHTHTHTITHTHTFSLLVLPSASWLWRQVRYFGLVFGFLLLVASAIAFNIRVEVKGEEDTVAGHVYSYMQGPEWDKFKDNLWFLYEYCSENWEECRDQFFDAFETPSARADTYARALLTEREREERETVCL